MPNVEFVSAQLRIEAALLDRRASDLYYLGPQFDRLAADLRGKASRINSFAAQLETE